MSQERDANDMLKPWVTPELRAEIQKKHEMHSSSRKSGDPKEFEAFKAQRNKVTAMLRAAKLEYIGLHEEQVGGERRGGTGRLASRRRCAAEAAPNTPLFGFLV